MSAFHKTIAALSALADHKDAEARSKEAKAQNLVNEARAADLEADKARKVASSITELLG
jgi:hypothetical protein